MRMYDVFVRRLVPFGRVISVLMAEGVFLLAGGIRVRRVNTIIMMMVARVMVSRQTRRLTVHLVSAKHRGVLDVLVACEIMSMDAGNSNVAVPNQAQRKQHRQYASHRQHEFHQTTVVR